MEIDIMAGGGRGCLGSHNLFVVLSSPQSLSKMSVEQRFGNELSGPASVNETDEADSCSNIKK